jgi:transcription elongation factor Elf1
VPLTPDAAREAYRRINAWRAAPAEPVTCPVCQAQGLVIIDRSTRPYAEWYALTCAACGLSETLNVPMSAPHHGID